MYILKKETLDRHLLKISVLISVIIHLLLIWLYRPLSSLNLLPIKELIEKEQTNQIEKRIEFQLVETPDDAESDIPPENTNLISDKNSRARNPVADQNLPSGEPFSKGDMDVKELPEPSTPSPGMSYSGSTSNSQTNNGLEESENKNYLTEKGFTFQKFSRQQLLKNQQEQNVAQPQSSTTNKPLYNNQRFRAEDLGGLTFNTYAWDFAPYMLAMKRKVEHNIFPPPAFTRMGLISGETILRFKVLPNGEVKDLEVLQYKGHPSLKETSVQAILNSSPFKPLPADFPEDYLEVTARFSYYVQR